VSSAADALAVVVVAHNSAAELPALLDATLAQLGPVDELVIVDNASADLAQIEALVAGATRVALIKSAENLGFGGGCHVGADATGAPLILFLNPDCVPEPGCVQALRAAAADHPSWGAWQAAVLQEDHAINTDGGVTHYIGIGWAGDCGLPQAALPSGPREVSWPSGAAMVVRRTAWVQTGGLDPDYFLYAEDLDLGLRMWLAGYAIGIAPAARVIHGYEFDKGQEKWFWLERNRWRTVLSVYPMRLLLLLAPALLAAELAIHAAALQGGWLAPKLRADAAALRDLPATLRRRRKIQASREIGARAFAEQLSSSLDSSFIPIPAQHWTARAQAAYWAIIRRIL
jgi:GT2 family glycosyltransferase